MKSDSLKCISCLSCSFATLAGAASLISLYILIQRATICAPLLSVSIATISLAGTAALLGFVALAIDPGNV